MQYYRVNVDKEETVSWTPKYEPLIRKLCPLVRARAGPMPWALSQFPIEVQPTELDGGEVLIVTLLRRLVVVRANHQRPGDARFLGGFRQANRLARAVRAGARHDLDAAGGSLADGGDDAFVLLVVERR